MHVTEHNATENHNGRQKTHCIADNNNNNNNNNNKTVSIPL